MNGIGKKPLRYVGARLGILLLGMAFCSPQEARAANILFVGNATPLTGADANLSSILTGMGHVVTPIAASASASTDADSKDLVFVSASVSSPNVNTKFKLTAKPVLVCENAILDDMMMTGATGGTNYGTVSGATQIAIQDGAHQMAAGLSGTQTVYQIADVLVFGQTGTGAQNVAALTTDATKRVIFGYPAGAVMVGMNAPGRRVGFFLETNGGGTTIINANGIALLKAAVSWALSLTPPGISTQPANQTATVGATATFSVTASGTSPFTYQWKKGGVAISGAVNASYTTPPTVAGDNGAVFTVTVSNGTGIAVNSANSALTVNTPPSITTQPTNQTVSVGATATFSVVAAGTAPLTYQWRKAGTNISGAINATYTTPPTVSGDNGALFSVVVGNVTGVNATSNNATLTVNAANVPPSITTQPTNQSVTVGAATSFTVVASGTAPLTYQWKKGGVDISGATNATYSTGPTVAGDNGAVFSVVVNNITATPVTSSNATLTVNTSPNVTTQPANQTVSVGATATFSVVAAGTAPLTYQWRKGGTNISGATNATYTTPPTVSGDNGALFSVVVGNVTGVNATSSNATLTVNAANVPPSITTQPTNQNAILGATATFTVVASGTAPLTYQWKKGGVDISGATNPSFTTGPTAAGDNGAVFSVVVNNVTATPVTSSNATLTVNTPPGIMTQPVNQSTPVGATATFSVVATGTAPLTYQWRKGGTNISGAINATYTTPPTVSGDNGALFSVVVGNVTGVNATSNNATLTVSAVTPPTITVQPEDQTVAETQAASFSVTATSGQTISYQWQKNGSNISGATFATYQTPATSQTDNGSLFTCIVSVSGASATTNAAKLLVVKTKTLHGLVHGSSPILDVVASCSTCEEVLLTSR